MERTVVLEATDDRFTLDIKSADRASRNRYLKNATDCCGEPVKEKKFCSQCNELVSATHRKIVEIAGQKKLLDAALLAKVLDDLESMEEIHITHVVDAVPSEVERRYERLLFADVAKKKEEDYATLRAYLGDKVGVGYGVFGNNKYGVVVEARGAVLFFRRLLDESQLVDIDEEKIAQLTTQKVDQELADLGRQAVEKSVVAEVDLGQFKDDRLEMEQQIIEQLLEGKLPEFVPKVAQSQVDDKKEKLKRLLAQ